MHTAAVRVRCDRPKEKRQVWPCSLSTRFHNSHTLTQATHTPDRLSLSHLYQPYNYMTVVVALRGRNNLSIYLSIYGST